MIVVPRRIWESVYVACAVGLGDALPGLLELFADEEQRGRPFVRSERVMPFVDRDAGLGARRPRGCQP